MRQFYIVFVGVFLSGQGAAQFFMYTTSKRCPSPWKRNLLTLTYRHYQGCLGGQLHGLGQVIEANRNRNTRQPRQKSLRLS